MPATADVDWTLTRTRLRESGIPDEAILLPSDAIDGWQGALRVGEHDGRWMLSTVDYGRPRPLLHRDSAQGIVTALIQYALSPMPVPHVVDGRERERLLEWAAPHVLDLAARNADDLLIDLPAGLLVDRIGALDGFLLYPTGTSFEARSLPVSALAQPLRRFVTTAPFRVRATVTPPWFGRQGGGVRFALEQADVGIRDLAREGQLRQVE